MNIKMSAILILTFDSTSNDLYHQHTHIIFITHSFATTWEYAPWRALLSPCLWSCCSRIALDSIRAIREGIQLRSRSSIHLIAAFAAYRSWVRALRTLFLTSSWVERGQLWSCGRRAYLQCRYCSCVRLREARICTEWIYSACISRWFQSYFLRWHHSRWEHSFLRPIPLTFIQNQHHLSWEYGWPLLSSIIQLAIPVALCLLFALLQGARIYSTFFPKRKLQRWLSQFLSSLIRLYRALPSRSKGSQIGT